MPFGLKNAGATYQRLVDKAFDSQIGQNIEVYVDNLVIKSHTEAETLRDIGEAFRTLRKINMKLNPKNGDVSDASLLRKPRITGPETKLYPNGKDMEDLDVATESSGTPLAIEKSPLDFDNENPSPPMTEGTASEVSLEDEVATMGPRLSKKRRRRVNDGVDANAPPKVLRKDYASVHPEQSTHGWKTLPTMGLAEDSTIVTPADTKGVSDPDMLSYAEPQPHREQSMTQHQCCNCMTDNPRRRFDGGVKNKGDWNCDTILLNKKKKK
nr:reverse transcriptase domain-containing protein [Tanacetum cinerariifolium]